MRLELRSVLDREREFSEMSDIVAARDAFFHDHFCF
jgi:hypothetical protein